MRVMRCLPVILASMALSMVMVRPVQAQRLGSLYFMNATANGQDLLLAPSITGPNSTVDVTFAADVFSVFGPEQNKSLGYVITKLSGTATGFGSPLTGSLDFSTPGAADPTDPSDPNIVPLSFSHVFDGTFVGTIKFDIANADPDFYNGGFTDDNGHTYRFSVTPSGNGGTVPEPGALALLGASIVGFGWMRLRRR